LRGIIIVVQVKAVKIYVAVVVQGKKKKGETHEIIKIDDFLNFTPH
jgi:hypothetical protein